MKKNLIALAVFSAFSGAASHRSNVTLYGIVDVGSLYSDPSGKRIVVQSRYHGGIRPATLGGARFRGD